MVVYLVVSFLAFPLRVTETMRILIIIRLLEIIKYFDRYTRSWMIYHTVQGMVQ